MKVLLYGEFSGVHIALAKGLKTHGCEVDLLSVGDGFKAIRNGKLRKRRGTATQKLLADAVNIFNLSRSIGKKYDVVQFISPRPGLIAPATDAELVFMGSAINASKRSFYYVAGCDANTFEAFSRKPAFFSGLCAGCQRDKGRTSCPWRSDFLSKRTDWLLQRVDGIIAATAGGYEDAHRSNSKLIGTITFPVDGRVLDRTEENPIIRVVHGINRKYSKGSDKIIEALQNTDLEEKAQVKVLEQLPFDLYMQEIANADIVIDQLYGDGLGMNALHAMAAGKLVLTSYDEALYPSSPAIPIAQTKQALVRQIGSSVDKLLVDRYAHCAENIEYVRSNHDIEAKAREFIDIWASA